MVLAKGLEDLTAAIKSALEDAGFNMDPGV
jgi:hypothetical protein